MTDLEITRRCAEAMGIEVREYVRAITYTHVFLYKPFSPASDQEVEYDPLRDGAQAMALVKRFHLHFWNAEHLKGKWCVSAGRGPVSDSYHADLNRAICECVANLKGV